ncbi:MAG: hypothetical protein U1F53_19470 [Burkholderiaceae bacterium]
MSRRPLHRCAITVFAVLAMLCSQLALARYVCPAQAQAEAMAAMVAAGQPCEGMDSTQPALCHQHASPGAQSFEPSSPPVASAPAILQMLVLPLLPDTAVARSRPRPDEGASRPPPDPLFLSTLRLRV